MKYFNNDESKQLKHHNGWIIYWIQFHYANTHLYYDVVPVIHKATGDLWWYMTDKNDIIGGHLSNRFKVLLNKLSIVNKDANYYIVNQSSITVDYSSGLYLVIMLIN